LKAAIALAVAAGLTTASVVAYIGIIDKASENAARQSLVAIGEQSTIRALLAGTSPVDELPGVVADAATRAGDPVPGLTLDGATARLVNDDGDCWQVVVDDTGHGPVTPCPTSVQSQTGPEQ
jgi:hypothetical protein